jgi:hypothetical protein
MSYVLYVRGLSPPKPAGLDTPNFCRHAPKLAAEPRQPKKNFKKKFTDFFFNFFPREILYWVVEICEADPRVGSNKGLKIYQIIQIIFYKVNISYLFSVHSMFITTIAPFRHKGQPKICQYAHLMLYQQNPTNFEFHKKIQKFRSQNCPKRLKIVYFCQKNPLFELFELFDLNLSNND